MRHQFKPAPDYADGRVRFQAEGWRLHANSSTLHVCLQSTAAVDGATSRWRLSAGDQVALGLRSDRRGPCRSSHAGWSVEHAHALLRTTQEYWWRWLGNCTYHGPYQTPVVRSALALKLMTYSPTGAMVAAPTTSLPEEIGGERNWDYRFTWLRDASFTLYAFFQVGMLDEANAFFSWLMRIGLGRRGTDVANLYTLDGEPRADEVELPQLSGYRGSSPVRIGNGAIHQLQLDVYGELLDSAYLFARFGGGISRALWRELHAVVDLAIDRWELPDASIWEARGRDDQYTYSKMMCWVAVDRGLRLAERFQLPARRRALAQGAPGHPPRCDLARVLEPARELHPGARQRGARRRSPAHDAGALPQGQRPQAAQHHRRRGHPPRQRGPGPPLRPRRHRRRRQRRRGRVPVVLVLAHRRPRPRRSPRRGAALVRAAARVRVTAGPLLGGGGHAHRRTARQLPAGLHPPRADRGGGEHRARPAPRPRRPRPARHSAGPPPRRRARWSAAAAPPRRRRPAPSA